MVKICMSCIWEHGPTFIWVCLFWGSSCLVAFKGRPKANQPFGGVPHSGTNAFAYKPSEAKNTPGHFRPRLSRHPSCGRREFHGLRLRGSGSGSGSCRGHDAAGLLNPGRLSPRYVAVGQKSGSQLLNPGKWNQRLKPAAPWWFYFDPYPNMSPQKT